MKIQNTKKLATILPVFTLGIIMAAIFVGISPIKAENASYVVGHGARPMPPLAFTTTVNGHDKAEVITTVNRGETINLDISAKQLITGVVGDMTISSSLPECGTVTMSMGCTPQGITTSLPNDRRISSDAHMSLTINVSKDMPPGTYWYSLATVPITDPSQNLPPQSTGYVEAFAIKVV
ncbi:MAG: hypothetical protein ACREAR_06975 [Nitrosotalea sp.]